MTLKDILEKGYGIDFSTLKFKLRTDLEFDNLTEDEVTNRLATDEFIVEGEVIEDFDIYGDEPNGYIELYPEEELPDADEQRRIWSGYDASHK